jgi:outer membrane protein assembly factor BamA
MAPGHVGARLAIAVCLTIGCASMPRKQYGVESIEWKGVEQMSRESLEACLATKEREPWTIRLGLSEATCGQPPFDQNVPDIGLITWPWTEWTAYDPAIFELDEQRILRWYRARGYYETEITKVRYSVDGEKIALPDRCTRDDCALTVSIEVEEGRPVFVRSVVVMARGALPPELMAELRAAPEMRTGERFDEATFEQDKQRLEDVLAARAYARAEVEGVVALDQVGRTARVQYDVVPGIRYRFGRVRVEGQGDDIEASAIIDVAAIRAGQPYDTEVIADAESAVYALGVFSSVRIEPEFREGSDVADLVIKVRRGRTERFRLGVGMMSGSLQRAGSGETVDVSQWDVHLLAGYEHENFLGGMRKLRIEERPRLIMLDDFPGVPDRPEPGNTVSLRFEQPRFPERRTVTYLDNQWDYGPDPFYAILRHDVATRIGVQRAFFRNRLKIELALQHDLYEITGALTGETDPGIGERVSSYRLPFVEQQITVDLRNNDRRPSRGVYFRSLLQEAVQLDYGSWTYLRWLPEARAYQRLFWGLVLAERVAFGSIFILDSSPELDPTSRQLGPQAYRLRGGGATSNRGFHAGELGDGIDGGRRRWEATVELRVPLGGDLGFALFFDTGDVSRTREVRLNQWNASTGFGLRYYTEFAPIRADAGWRIPSLQKVGGDEPEVEVGVLPSAFHLTLGEAF